MKIYYLSLFMAFLITPNFLWSQNEKSNSYYKMSSDMVNQFFADMKSNNIEGLRNAFDPYCQIEVADMRGERVVTTDMTVEEFLSKIQETNATNPNWDEKLQRFQMKMNNNYVSMTIPYIYKVNNVKSHCGSNNFHFIEQDDKQWKIQNLSYTIRNCSTP